MIAVAALGVDGIGTVLWTRCDHAVSIGIVAFNERLRKGLEVEFSRPFQPVDPIVGDNAFPGRAVANLRNVRPRVHRRTRSRVGCAVFETNIRYQYDVWLFFRILRAPRRFQCSQGGIPIIPLPKIHPRSIEVGIEIPDM